MERLINRRIFFQLASAGVAGCFISPRDLFPAAGGFQLQAQTLTRRGTLFSFCCQGRQVSGHTGPEGRPLDSGKLPADNDQRSRLPAGLLPSLASQFNHL
jgi:hypothetical protein